MWRAVLEILQNLPLDHIWCMWVPSHLLDPGKAALLEQFLAEGGDFRLLQGNLQADLLADKGAAMDARAKHLQDKEKLAAKLAGVVHTMQILIWAAFQGYIASDQETDAAQAMIQAELQLGQEFEEYEYEDPFLQEFLAQDDAWQAPPSEMNSRLCGLMTKSMISILAYHCNCSPVAP